MMLGPSVHHSVALQSWDLVPFNFGLYLSEQQTNKHLRSKQISLNSEHGFRLFKDMYFFNCNSGLADEHEHVYKKKSADK